MYWSPVLQLAISLAYTVNGRGIDGVRMYGGGGKGIKSTFSPGDDLAQNAVITGISCRGDERLDYLRVEHLWSSYDNGIGRNKQQTTTFEYGRSYTGHDQGSVRPNGGHMKRISVWTCKGGKHNNEICGISFEFTTSSRPHMCGRVDGTADVVDVNHIHAFVVQYIGDSSISAIGWS